jgi:hemolysin III
MMVKPIEKQRREQSLREEIANSISHGIGFVAAIFALPFLFAAATGRGRSAAIIGAAVFAISVILLYAISAIYHALPHSTAKRVLQLLDHGAIFLLIAGTYTPITLGVLRGPWGWTLLTMVWSLAILGILLKATRGIRHPRISMALYVGMGWLALIAVRPLWLHMPIPGILWLAAGGVAYTGGLTFFALERVRYAHFAWHLCVLAGTACHFVAVMNYSG